MNFITCEDNYTDTQLDRKKQNILNPLQENFQDVPRIQNILAEVGFTEEEYGVVSISSDSVFQIHLKQKANACFVKNYFVGEFTSMESKY